MPVFNAPGWLLKQKAKTTASPSEVAGNDDFIKKDRIEAICNLTNRTFFKKSFKVTFKLVSCGFPSGSDAMNSKVYILFHVDSTWRRMDTKETVDMTKIGQVLEVSLDSLKSLKDKILNDGKKEMYLNIISGDNKYYAAPRSGGDPDYKLTWEDI